jgi:hypothetical protein
MEKLENESKKGKLNEKTNNGRERKKYKTKVTEIKETRNEIKTEGGTTDREINYKRTNEKEIKNKGRKEKDQKGKIQRMGDKRKRKTTQE